jgi:hypothetical protein
MIVGRTHYHNILIDQLFGKRALLQSKLLWIFLIQHINQQITLMVVHTPAISRFMAGC